MTDTTTIFQPQGLLTVNLKSVVDNWCTLNRLAGPAECGAVVKADAYGLGFKEVSTALRESGCRSFFVCSLDEGLALRKIVGVDASIYVLNGFMGTEGASYISANLIPVINSLSQLQLWVTASLSSYPIALMLDTGITRLGVSSRDFASLLSFLQEHDLLLTYLFSHYACADEPDNPMNQQQTQVFMEMTAQIKRFYPDVRLSLANTAVLYWQAQPQQDLVRPGIGLYGVSPDPNSPIGLCPVVELQLPIIQLTQLQTCATVGYNATKVLGAGAIVATVGCGYADGLLRSFSNRAYGYFRGVRVPMVGRVSMDYCVFDLTTALAQADYVELVAEPNLHGLTIELIGENQTVDQLAVYADTIGYELLTRLGERFKRVYKTSDNN